MSNCKKETSYKYTSRSSPPFSANKCKSMKKKGNDGNIYKSVPNKKGVFRWILVRKSLKKDKKLTLKEIQNIAKRYNVTKSGTKKQVAHRIINLRKNRLKKKDEKNLLNVLI